MNMDNITEQEWELIQSRVMKLVDRRKSLCENSPRCPDCNTDQVQLIEYDNHLAKWKCRHCKMIFTYEPTEANNGKI